MNDGDQDKSAHKMSSEAELDPMAEEVLHYLLQLPTETYLENPQIESDAFYQVDVILNEWKGNGREDKLDNDKERKDYHNEEKEYEKDVDIRKKAIRMQPTVKAKRGRPRKPTLSRKNQKKRRQVL